MTRWRYRLARWLVGPFVNVPERTGVWVVSRLDDGVSHMVVEADKFRLKTGITSHRDPNDRIFGGTTDQYERLGFLTRWGRFVGTVKYR